MSYVLHSYLFNSTYLDDNLTHKKLLTPISTATKADQVEEQVLHYLRSGNFKPGDTIPKEEELSKALNVSRPVIREALSRLRMFGMIESRKRRGAILRQPDLFSALERVLMPNMLSETTRQDIFELRLVLEMGISDLLFLRKTASDLAELEQIVSDESLLLEKKQSPENILLLLEKDLAFHSKLYQISGNKMLQSLQRVILPTIKHVVDHQFKMDPLSYGKITHFQLLTILKNGNPKDFREAMREHLTYHFEQLPI